MQTLTATNFKFPQQTKVYNGKVRDVYFVGDKIVMVATDRISAFDVILPKGIPYKGQILNQIASIFLDALPILPKLSGFARPDGYYRRGLQRLSGRNDCTRLLVRKRMACL